MSRPQSEPKGAASAATAVPEGELRTGRRICSLCNASCGLLLDIDGAGTIHWVRANPHDVASAGYACPKGLALGAVEGDPNRLTTPLLRRDGELKPASWTEAFDEIARRLPPIIEQDRNSCGVYIGNPAAHHLDYVCYTGALLGALATHNFFTPSTVDTMPKQLAVGLMFGTGSSIPVPDLDRTRLLLVLGSNPVVSNGSTVAAANIRSRLQRLRDNGGRLVVIDPLRTSTADLADQHLAIRPGTDAYLLMALVSVIAENGWVRLGRARDLIDGLDEVLELAAGFPPETVADVVGIAAPIIRDLARQLTSIEPAVVHARIGTCTQEFGSVTSWLVDVLNTVTGNLDREGGAMFALPPAGGPTTWPGTGRPWPRGRWQSRVRGLPEAQGELPVACLAEEIEVEGPGRIRALITLAGNPARSLPNSVRLEAALDKLDFMLCVDTYLNETTRHANVVLPSARLITRGHLPITTDQYALRSIARYSPPMAVPRPGELEEWVILLRLTAIVRGERERTVADLDEEVAASAARRAARAVGCSAADALAAVAGRTGPQRLLDMRLRSGPFGDHFGSRPGGLCLADLERNPDGIDFGPLRPRLPEVLRTPNGRIQLAPEPIIADVSRLREGLARVPEGLVMINRRQIRGMNSWLHNALPQPDSGQCALLMHPDDAVERRLVDGDQARVRSRAGTIEVEIRISDAVRPGVVSMPHGWGHEGGRLRLDNATAAPGANVNTLVDDVALEPLTSTVIFNGMPVVVEPAAG